MKDFMKKAAVIVLALALVLTAGCAGQAPAAEQSESPSDAAEASAAATQQTSGGTSLNPDEPVTVTLWYYYTGESQSDLEQAVSTFNQSVGRENGVVVEAVAKGNLRELEDAVTDAAKGVINAEEMPNIFSCYADKAMELDEIGAICNLKSYFTAEEQSEYVPGFIEDGIFDGRLLVLPIVKSTELLYINKTVLDEFAAATGAYSETDLETWEGLYDLSKAYYEWTDAATPETPWDGRGFAGIDELANFLIVSSKQLGTDLLDGEAGRVNLDKKVLRKIFDVYFPAISLGYFDEVGKFRSDDVKTGDLAAYVGASSGASYFPTFTEIDSQQVDIELLAASYPIFKDGSPFAIQQGAGMAVAKTNAAEEEGSCLFLKWFTDETQNIDFARMTGYLPVMQQAYESDQFDATLSALTDGDSDAQNMQKVYDIALEEIVEESPYAAKPFDGSYDARTILKNSLTDAGLAGKEDAAALKAQGQTAEKILQGLDLDKQFEDWISQVCSELDDAGIAYTEA